MALNFIHWRGQTVLRCLLPLLGVLLAFGVSAPAVHAQEDGPVFLPLLTTAAVPVTQLAGGATTPATAAIPDLPFTFRPQDYSADHPDLSDLMVSFNTLFVVFSLDTTVAEANAILRNLDATVVGGSPGIGGQIEGVILLRLPTTTHQQMITVVDALRANDLVKIAVQDSLLETPEPITDPAALIVRSLPNANGGTPPGWTWQVAPTGGNWGLELMRVPQMWNLNSAISKQGTATLTGVHDDGFSTTHPDLTYAQNFSFFTRNDHGTHVAGTIGATFNNGIGVDGVNPFTRLVVHRFGVSPVWSLFDLLDLSPDLQVVNMSLGYGWSQRTPPINPNTNVATQWLVSSQGQTVAQFFKLLAAFGHSVPFVLVAAGNDSGPPQGNIEARWSSPFTYAALVLGAENIMVVEAVGQAGATATRAPFSNVMHAGAPNAAVSAPGVAILSTFFSTPYNSISGTSMATPHVTGLVSYLLSLEPTLTHIELRKLLLDNDVAVTGGASNRVDAFASALAIDGLRGNDTVLRKLVDVDDGSLDGNQRVLCDACADFLDEDVDGDGGRGDGSVDMADFRRWRDWLLQMEAPAGLALDGTATHAKKDVNGDSVVGTAAQENVYPQGDFNGDGILDRAATRFVPGAVNAAATDLDVLAKVFVDTDYAVADLNGLIDSADLDVDAQTCLDEPDVVEVRSQLFVTDTTTPIEERVHTSADPRQIYTAALDPAGYTAKVTAHDAAGKVLGVALEDFPLLLGSDAFFIPECGNISVDPEIVAVGLNVSESTTETVRLVSHRLQADYALINSLSQVTATPDQGTVQRDTAEEIALTFTCPDQPDTFPADFDLSFTSEGGQTLTEAVPEIIDIELKCLAGGVTAAPDPIDLKASPSQTVSATLHLQNFGTALDYQATATDFVTLTQNASGVLGEEEQAIVSLAATCPAASGQYTSTIALSFLGKDGKPATVSTPAEVAVNLDCGCGATNEEDGPLVLDWNTSQIKIADMNNCNQIVGKNAANHAFIWTPSASPGLPEGFTDLGTLGGSTSSAIAANDQGQVIGVSDASGGRKNVPFLWLPEPAYDLTAGMHDLTALNCDTCGVVDINNSGEIVGRHELVDEQADPRCVQGLVHGFMWAAGTLTDLGTLPDSYEYWHPFGCNRPYSLPTAINDGGQIVGHASCGFQKDTVDSDTHEITCDHAARFAVDAAPVDMGFLGTYTYVSVRPFNMGSTTSDLERSSIVSINQAGDAVGESTYASSWSNTNPPPDTWVMRTAVLWQGLEMIDLGIDFRAWYIDDQGNILGLRRNGDSTQEVALRHGDGTFTTIADLFGSRVTGDAAEEVLMNGRGDILTSINPETGGVFYALWLAAAE